MDAPTARLVSYLPGHVDLHAGQETEAWFDRMDDGTTLVQWRRRLFSWPDTPRLLGGTCESCSTTTFPARPPVRAAPAPTSAR